MRNLDPKTHENIRRVLLFLFTLYFTYMFVKNGWRKFDPEGFWGAPFARWGYPVWFLYLIGVMEFGGGLAILIPRIAGYGALVLATVMFGAFMTRLIHGMGVDDAMSIFFYMVSMLLLAYEYNPLKEWISSKQEPS